MVEKNISRRDFLAGVTKASASVALAGTLAGCSEQLSSSSKSFEPDENQMIWADLIHLSYNMWYDREMPAGTKIIKGWEPYVWYYPEMRFEKDLWNDILKKMSDVGMNMIVIDLGDGVEYRSHPELAVKGAWTVGELKTELGRIRKMGLEPIPKLNFSTTHDTWLGKYHRMVSTDTYYAVCRDLIAEVIDIFDRPRFFHLGMDEEAYDPTNQLSVVRQHDLWWHDFYYLVNQVERNGSRAWIWSDYVWHHPELFYKKMPKTVVQSNWHYGKDFDLDKEGCLGLSKYTQPYLDLEEHGYDQIPTGSNHSNKVNFEMTVEYCTKHISPERLLGFLQTPWRPTVKEYRQHHFEAIEQVSRKIQES